MIRAVAALALTILAAGCATVAPGTYAFSTLFTGETLVLRPDGTFTYEAWSDDGGAYWKAAGTWSVLAGRKIATRVTKVTLATGVYPPSFANEEVWTVTGNGLSRYSRKYERQLLYREVSTARRWRASLAQGDFASTSR